MPFPPDASQRGRKRSDDADTGDHRNLHFPEGGVWSLMPGTSPDSPSRPSPHRSLDRNASPTPTPEGDVLDQAADALADIKAQIDQLNAHVNDVIFRFPETSSTSSDNGDDWPPTAA